MFNSSSLRQAVCVWDPAIDVEASQLAEYIRSRDLKHLAFKGGAKAEIYHLRPITNEIGIWIDSATSDQERYARAFYACVVKVDNLVTQDSAAGVVHDEWRPTRATDSDHKISKASDLFTAQDKEIFPRATIYEIGSVAWGFSFFPQRTGASFALLPTSHATWIAALSRSAAPAESTVADGNVASEPAAAH